MKKANPINTPRLFAIKSSTLRAPFCLFSFPILSALLGQAALAQTTEPPPSPARSDSDEHDKLSLHADYSFVGAGDVSYRGLKGSSGSQAFSLDLAGKQSLSDGWFVPAYISSLNLRLGEISGIPIPKDINTINFGAGVGYHLNDNWTITAMAGPALYRLEDIGGDEIGFGGMVQADYAWRPNVRFMFGLAVESEGQIPVFPLVGVRWELTDKLTLDLMLPHPGLVYQFNPRLDFFVTGGGQSTTFRAANDFGNKIGQARYNNALGIYQDLHLGGGFQYKFPCGASIKVEAGYSFARQIDYKDVDQTIKFGSGPYVQAGLGWKF